PAAHEALAPARPERVVDLRDARRGVQGEPDAHRALVARDRDGRGAAGLVGRDRVRVARRARHLRQEVLLVRRGDLVAEAGLRVLLEERLPATLDREPEGIAVDLPGELPRRRGPGAAG